MLAPVAKADTRSVLKVPGPVLLTFPDTFHWLAVIPNGDTGPAAVSKSITAESKRKSPWKPMIFWLAVTGVQFTGLTITVVMGTEVSIVSIGRETVIVVWSGAAGRGSGG